MYDGMLGFIFFYIFLIIIVILPLIDLEIETFKLGYRASVRAVGGWQSFVTRRWH